MVEIIKRRVHENESGLEVDRIETKRKREIQKNNRIKNRRFKMFPDDDDYQYIEDNYDQRFNKDHKRCEKEKRDLQKEIEVVKRNCANKIEDEKEKCRDDIKEIKDICRYMLETKDKENKTDITDMEELFEKEIKQREKIYKVELDSKTEEPEDEIKAKNAEFE